MIKSLFLKVYFWEIERTRQMTEQEDNNNLGELVFEDNIQETKSWACLGQTCSRFLFVFLSQLLSFVVFGELIFQKLKTNQLLG